jgi:16S rRNA (adenine1518-N6/adenine1519-N6)-dimethyltransferase
LGVNEGCALSLLGEAKSLLRKHRIVPKRSLGQNFVIEPQVLQLMVNHASLDSGDTVLEVGAGMGFLTNLLRKACKRVLAVEVDAGLVSVLREQLDRASNVTIIEGNVLKKKIPTFDKVVSIPPYQISSPLLAWLFHKPFESAVFIFQKEFANRLVASVGSEDYGWLTVLTHLQTQVKLLDPVPQSMFYPRPKIDSVIALMKPKRLRPLSSRNESLFQELLQSLFRHRNKKVRNAVSTYFRAKRGESKDRAKMLSDSLPWRDKRVRELSPEDFGELACAIIK